MYNLTHFVVLNFLDMSILMFQKLDLLIEDIKKNNYQGSTPF